MPTHKDIPPNPGDSKDWLAALEAIGDRNRRDLIAERARIERMIDTAAAERAKMPDNHWQGRHRLQARQEAIAAIVAALTEEDAA